MKKVLLIGVCIIALLASGCGKTESPAANGDKPKSQRQIANEMMAIFVEAVNKGDAATLSRLCFKDEEKPLEMARAAIEDYKFFFKNKQITSFEKAQSVNEGEYRYKLIDAAGNIKNMLITANNDWNTPRIVDDFLNYSYDARGFLNLFIKDIKAKDANKLAGLLNPDDVPYPVSKARKAIANYEKAFDTETLQFKVHSFKEWDLQSQYPSTIFTYALYGS